MREWPVKQIWTNHNRVRNDDTGKNREDRKKKNFENVAENPEKGETVHYSSMYYGH